MTASQLGAGLGRMIPKGRCMLLRWGVLLGGECMMGSAFGWQRRYWELDFIAASLMRGAFGSPHPSWETDWTALSLRILFDSQRLC